MNRVDVHPEDLLHAARQDALDSESAGRLEHHLASCATCSVELGAAEALAQDMAAQPGDGAAISRIVRGATGMEASLPRPRTSRRRMAVQIAAAGVMIGMIGGAAAAYWALAAPKPDVAGPARDVTGSPSGEVAGPVSGERAGRPGAAPAEAVDGPRAPETPTYAPTPSGETAPTRRVESAEDLLARAGRERRGGQHARAAQTYRVLQGRHPRSREALLSHVSLGRLLLGQASDPAGALGQFDAYLSRASAGVLSEEARVGRALALERLGRAAEARAAWEAVLEHHPDSPNAARARWHLQR